MRLFMLLECCKVATQCDEDKEREGKEDNKNKSHARMSVCVSVCVGLVCDSCVRVCMCLCLGAYNGFAHQKATRLGNSNSFAQGRTLGLLKS